jgi:hypothetical protein
MTIPRAVLLISWLGVRVSPGSPNQHARKSPSGPPGRALALGPYPIPYPFKLDLGAAQPFWGLEPIPVGSMAPVAIEALPLMAYLDSTYRMTEPGSTYATTPGAALQAPGAALLPDPGPSGLPVPVIAVPAVLGGRNAPAGDPIDRAIRQLAIGHEAGKRDHAPSGG